MKRLISFVLVLVMCLGLFSVTATAADMPFTDVKPTAYYATAVQWAVENNITTGKSATRFAPDDPCTRAQVVTFLWRACGEPEPTMTSHGFNDVKSSAYYNKAVLWAVENGITTGKSATRFAPDDPCTRAQVVTFLHRAAGEPEPTMTSHGFDDVKASAYYNKAVLWAVENNITKGTSSTKFSPDDTCTRGQVVTFLYRAKDLLNPAPAPCSHSYDNACDASCNVCGATRIPAAHVYDNDDDASCNICGAIRDVATTPLTIATQPEDYYMSTGNARFAVTASGGDGTLNYQWQYKTNGMSDFANVTSALSWASGYNTDTLKITNISVNEFNKGYQFRCVVSDNVGTKAISNAAKLTRKITITTQPQNVTCYAGDTVQLSVAATGGVGELSYRWTRKGPQDTYFSSIGDSLHSDKLRPTMTILVHEIIFESDYVYRCEISDEAGNIIYSDEVTLTEATPVSIATQPQNAYVEEHTNAEFSVVAKDGVAPYTYQWQESFDGTTFEDLGPTYGCQGYNTPDLRILVQSSIYGCKYRCVITDARGKTVTSNAAGIYRPFSFTTQPTNKTAYTGETATFTVAAKGFGTLTYQWQVKLPGFRNYVNVNSTIAPTGSTGATLTVNVSDAMLSGALFRCKVTDGDGAVHYSNTARLTAKSKLVVTGSEKVVSDNSYTLHVEASGGSGNYTYTWYKRRYQRGESADSFSFIPTGDSTSTVSVTASSGYTYEYKCVVSDGEQSAQKIFSIYG